MRPTDTPTTLCEAQLTYTWATVRNLSESEVWLAFDVVEIQGSKVGQDKYVLQAGEREMIQIAPNQKLVAVSVGGAAQVSLVRSLALAAYPQVL